MEEESLSTDIFVACRSEARIDPHSTCRNVADEDEEVIARGKKNLAPLNVIFAMIDGGATAIDWGEN
jgi:hypothetical protein